MRELREKIEEAESFGARKLKAQLSAMDSRVGSLEEQLEVATRERANAHRTLRRQEKKMKELLNNIEDERKQAESYKSDVSKNG